MYLTSWDLAGIILALVVSLTLVITTAIANARLTKNRNYWRSVYYSMVYQNTRSSNEQAKHCGCAECD